MEEKIKEMYESPEIKIVEMNMQSIICMSNQDASNNGYSSNDYIW